MGLSVQVNTEVYPPDTEVAIEGVGRFLNGGPAVEVPVAAEETYYIINGRPLVDDPDDESVTISGSAEFTPPESPEVVGAATTAENPEPQPEYQSQEVPEPQGGEE